MTSSLPAHGDKPALTRENALNQIDPRRLRRLRGTSGVPFVIIGLLLALGAAFAINSVTDFPKSVLAVIFIGIIPAIMILQKPELGTYILIFTVFTNLSDLSTEKGYPSINQPLIVLTILSILLNYMLGNGKLNRFPKLSKFEIALAAFLMTVIGSAFVATNREVAGLEIENLVKDIAIGACVIITLNSKEKLKTGLVILVTAISFVSLLGVIKIFSGTEQDFWGLAQRSVFGQVSDSGELRYGGPIGESNIWAQVVSAALPLAIYRFMFDFRPRNKTLYLASAALMLLAIVITQSRGTIISLAIILPLMAFDLRVRGPAILFTIGLGVLIIFLLPERYTERIRNLNLLFSASQQEFGYAQDEAVAGRREKMLIGLEMFKEHPILGVGFGNYTVNYWDYAEELGLESDKVVTSAAQAERHPHSLYIEIMAETGLLGISSFIYIIWLLFQGIYTNRKNYMAQAFGKDWSVWLTAIGVGLLSFLVGGFFLHGIKWRFIWMLMSVTLAMIKVSEQDSDTKFISASSFTLR